MTGETKTFSGVNTRPDFKYKYQASLKFDYIVVALSGWIIGGLYLDGWAHNNIPQLETFLTPWHGVLYSGFLSAGGFLTYTYIRQRQNGYPGKYALPQGYSLSMLGVLIFLVGGIGDGIGHTLFGIERGLEPLISPTHLQLALGVILIISGPARSVWRRRAGESYLAILPLIFSFTFIYLVLNFFTDFAHPVIVDWTYSRKLTQNIDNFYALGMISIFFQTALVMGFILVLLRYWRLPVGATSFILIAGITLSSLMMEKYQFILPVLLAGIVIEVLHYILKPSAQRPVAFRLFAFGVPFIQYTFLFLGEIIMEHLYWSIYLTCGAIVLAGVIGLLVSYLVLLPATETE